MNKRILYQSDNELIAYRVTSRMLIEEHRFQITTQDVSEFKSYLKANLKAPIYWLIETAQEEYQNALLPHVIGRDRRNLLNHKVQRLFEYTNYTYAAVQGRETQGRGDDRVLFMALSNPNLLQPWLEMILAYKVPLAGIYSVPLLSHGLLKFFPKNPYTLLVTQTLPLNSTTPQGLRQSFFVEQQLQLSRVIPLTTSEPTEYANYLVTQLVKLRRYLETSHLLPYNSTPTVIILSYPPLLNGLEEFLKKNPVHNLQIQGLDGHELAYKMKWRCEEPVVYLYHLVAYQFAHTTAKNHYAKLSDTRYFLYRRLRQVLYIASLLILGSMGAVSGFAFQEALLLKEKGEKKQQEIHQKRVELQTLRARLPELPLDVLYIRNIVDMGLYIKSRHLSPEESWIKLSKVLTLYEDLVLERLEWGVSNTRTDMFSVMESSTISKPAEEMVTNPKTPDASEESGFFFEGLRLQGKVISTDGSYRPAKIMRRLSQFLKDLRQTCPEWLINEVVSPYYGVNPETLFRGQIGQAETLQAPFVIEIFIKHRHAEKTP